MLTIEQYNNLSSHINYARMDVDSIMTNKSVATDGEVIGLIVDAKEHLVEVQHIIDFLVVGYGAHK